MTIVVWLTNVRLFFLKEEGYCPLSINTPLSELSSRYRRFSLLSAENQQEISLSFDTFKLGKMR